MRFYWTIFACALLALTTACGGSSGESGSGASSAPRSAGGGIDSGLDAGGTTPAATAIDDAKIIVTSFLDLEVRSLRGAFDEVSRQARGYGGFVAEANIAEGSGSDTATLRLRVPAVRHDDLAAALRGMRETTVKREELRSNEVTADYADLQSRLRNLESNEAQYRTLLARANTIDEILKVNAQLNTVRDEIERTLGRIKLYEDQSELATLNVSLSAVPLVGAPKASKGPASPLEVLHDALSVSATLLQMIANTVVVLTVAGLWLVPAGVVLLLVRRRYGRRLVALWSRLLSW